MLLGMTKDGNEAYQLPPYEVCSHQAKTRKSVDVGVVGYNMGGMPIDRFLSRGEEDRGRLCGICRVLHQ